MDDNNSAIAECIGLWIAEGDKKTIREITFTNNCLDLVLFFKEIIRKIYTGSNQPRMYIYSPSQRQLFYHLEGFKKINFYIDKRANRPYYIYRLADSEFLRRWKDIVDEFSGKEEHYADILRGIFAGEGNVHHSIQNHNTKELRIASKDRNDFIEKILRYHDIRFDFDISHRSYNLRINPIDRFIAIRLTELHPDKEARFIKILDSIKEIHYSPGQLEELILKTLHDNFMTTKELSASLKRSPLRILEVLQKLQKEDKVGHIRTNQRSCWSIKANLDKYRLNEKKFILSNIHVSNSFAEMGKNLNISRKSISKRVIAYEKEGVIEKDAGWWKMTEAGKQFIAGIDEAGR